MGNVECKHPSEEECRNLWNKYDTPLHIRKHCEAVAKVARAVGQALNDNGAELDIDLIYAAGLTHDVVRLRNRHDLEGAKVMRDLGYSQEAAIIQVHMLYDSFSSIKFVTETDIVCLADRTVIEHEYAGIDKRFQYIIDKAARHGHPEAAVKILEYKKDIRRLADEIEEMTGKSLDEITKDIVVE